MDGMRDTIARKRDGKKLSGAEIRSFVRGYTAGDIPDHQAAALLMAIFWRGLDEEETAALTGAMADSGERLDLTAVPGIKADKHSTGGVGETTPPNIITLTLTLAGSLSFNDQENKLNGASCPGGRCGGSCHSTASSSSR